MTKKVRIGDTVRVMVGPDEYREYVVGPDVDLDAEIVLDSKGERITEARVEQMVEEARRRAGRPSLTGQSEHSPHVSFRVPRRLAERAEALAEREGKSLSQLGREALEQYVDKAG